MGLESEHFPRLALKSNVLRHAGFTIGLEFRDGRAGEYLHKERHMEPTPKPTPVPVKQPRKKPASKPKAPRVIDPEIAKLRAQHVAAVAALRKSRESAKMLDKLALKISKLTEQDRERLREAIGAPVAPE